ncbi:MAG: hypothetical protein ABJN65_08155 [Parasphingorhabdus sp.]
MSMKMKLASDQIKRDLPQTEASVDEALISVSELMSTLVQARLSAGVPASTGQVAIRRLAKAQMALVDASTDVLRVHGELKKIGKEYAGWDTHECPELAVAKGDAKLSIVA